MFYKNNIDYKKLIIDLEEGKREKIKNLLWCPDSQEIEFLPITFIMLEKLRKPEISYDKLKIQDKIDKGNLQMIIFNCNWIEDDLKFSPIIIEKNSAKILGIMQPFNEINFRLKPSWRKKISSLSNIWIKFVLKERLGIK